MRMEEGEKGIIFRTFKDKLQEAGFLIETSTQDHNFVGYGLIPLRDALQKLGPLIKSFYFIDHYLLKPFVPKKLAPFEYLILSKI